MRVARRTIFCTGAMYCWLCLSACPKPPAGPQPVPTRPGEEPPPPIEVTDEQREKAADLLQRLVAAENRGDEAAVSEIEETLLSAYRGTAAASRRLLELARRHQQREEVGQAIELLQRIIDETPDFKHIQRVRYDLSEMLIDKRRFEQAAAALAPAVASEDDPDVRRQWEPVLFDVLKAIGRGADAFRSLISAFEKTEDEEYREKLARQMLETIDSGIGPTVIRELYEKLKEDERFDFPFALIGYKLAKVLYHIRNYEVAQQVIEELRVLAPDDPWTDRTADVMHLLDARLQTDPREVGVILPLSGRHQLYGETALVAIKLAFSRYPQLDLIVRDSESDPQIASQAVEELVLKKHVICIIGPLVGRAAKAAALKAEDLEVPILLLAYQEGLPQLGPFVFRNALTAEMQARGIAKVAFEKFGYDRFALLYPRTSFGRSMMDAFWDEVDERRGEVRAVESYPHDETNFQNYIKRIVGRYWLDARPAYKHKFLEIRHSALPSHRQNHLIEELKKNLPPVIDFDAILIPDYYKPIGLIAPAIAFEDIILTRDEKEIEKIKKATGRKKLHPVTLLGGSGWNHPKTVERGRKYVENAVFVDGFYLDNPASRVRDFVAAFREKTGSDPRLPDAQAFDTAGIVGHVLELNGPSTRPAMTEALDKMQEYSGVTGRITFDEDGEGKRDLFVFTIRDGELRLLTEDDIPPRPAG